MISRVVSDSAPCSLVSVSTVLTPHHQTFDVNLDVHAVPAGTRVVDIPVDLDGGHVWVLNVKWRPLSDVAFQPKLSFIFKSYRSDLV